MVNVVTGRGGWFHNFGGLSAPINLWTAAYYKSGTFNTGFDVWVDKQIFNDDFTSFEADFTYHGNNNEYTVIVAMSDKKRDYKVFLNGEEIKYNLRDGSALEIKVSGEYRVHKLIIK